MRRGTAKKSSLLLRKLAVLLKVSDVYESCGVKEISDSEHSYDFSEFESDEDKEVTIYSDDSVILDV